MASKKPPIKNEILADYLISSSHDLKSIGGLLVSGVISTFGVYSVIKPFFEGVSTLNTALIAFVMVLIIFDTIKRGALTKFFNSLLKKKIIGSKPKKGYLVISVFATIFMVLLDGLGSWSTAEKGADLYTQFKTNSSTEYQILQQNAETGKATAQNYTIELSAWQQSKADAQQTCNEKWNGWKAKYKAQCKEEWNTANPMPTQTADGQIKIDDYQSIKNDRQGFLDEYLFIILFTLLLLMTLLMQYLTIAKIYDDYNEIEEGLTFERIEFINDTIQEHETILAEHEQQVAEMMADSSREKKSEDRKFQKVGEAIAITHKKKMVETRGKTVQRIANNVYVPHEESKAGFVYNPFGEEGNNQSEPLNESVKRSRYNEADKKENNQGEPLNGAVNGAVITGDARTIDFSLFTEREKQLINILWANGAVKRNKALTPRDTALKEIGDNKANTTALRDLYKKLINNGYAFRKIGYFAKAEL
ncbi:hypothetical protein KJ680_06145 [bacterium]|nr:hypothetical protein [bacterium]